MGIKNTRFIYGLIEFYRIVFVLIADRWCLCVGLLIENIKIDRYFHGTTIRCDKPCLFYKYIGTGVRVKYKQMNKQCFNV